MFFFGEFRGLYRGEMAAGGESGTKLTGNAEAQDRPVCTLQLPHDTASRDPWKGGRKDIPSLVHGVLIEKFRIRIPCLAPSLPRRLTLGSAVQ